MTLLLNPCKLKGSVTPPPSKSQAHRALIAAALAGEGSSVSGLDLSQDILATRRCLEALMTEGSDLPRLDCGESGSTLRFLVPLSLVLRGGGVFTGQGRLMERPLDTYTQLFVPRGISWVQHQGTLTIRGRLQPGLFSLAGDVSSQFITGLLFALPLLEGDSQLELTSPLESRGYVDLSLDMLARFGVNVEYDGHRHFFIPGGQHYRPASVTLEADYSQAAFFFAANGLGNQVDILGLSPYSLQGDRVITQYAAQLSGPGNAELDVSQCPDLVPALAVQAALRTGQVTRIVGAGRLRIKESDRLAAVTAELTKLGGQITQGKDFLEFFGVSHFQGGVCTHAHNDHRIAMMLAVAATAALTPFSLEGAESVRKSYPGFWQDYALLGGCYQEVLQP